MKLTFLGTGTSQGVPVIGCTCAVCLSADERDKRLRTSALLSSGNTTLVFDTGPDFRAQMLRANVTELDAVVFTHPHKDHTAGLDDVRPFIFRQEKPMAIYANALTIASLKREYAYAFATEKYPGAPTFDLHEISDAPFQVGDIELTPIPVDHYNMPVLGFRAGNLAYVTDANYISDASLALLEGLEVLVLNALRKEQHYSHFTLEEALAVVERLQPKRAVFTHISHLMGKHADVSRELPAHVALATDGLVVQSG